MADDAALENIKQSEYRNNPHYRRRVDQAKAAAAVTTCVHPLCDQHVPPQPKTSVLCIAHAFDVWASLDDQDAAREPITEHRLRRELRQRQSDDRAVRQRESGAIQPGWIYYLQVDERIKIGFSTDVRQRMRAYPPHSELLAAHPGTPTLERDIHRQFIGHLAHGREWFRADQQILEHIAQVITQFGPPPKRFHYKFREGAPQQIKIHRRSR